MRCCRTPGEVWADREEALTPEITRELERRVVLSVLDRKWREHLYEMDYLKEGIGLRAMAQRDPLVEYQREGFDMFAAMLDSLKEESVGFLYNLQVQVVPADQGAPVQVEDGDQAASGGNGAAAAATAEGAPVAGGRNGGALPPPKPVGGKQAGGGASAASPARAATKTRVRAVEPLPTQQAAAAAAATPASTQTDGAPAALRAKGLGRPGATPTALSYSGPSDAGDGQATVTGAAAKPGGAATATSAKEPGRNAPCPCGSGKKYKLCHGRPGGAE